MQVYTKKLLLRLSVLNYIKKITGHKLLSLFNMQYSKITLCKIKIVV